MGMASPRSSMKLDIQEKLINTKVVPEAPVRPSATGRTGSTAPEGQRVDKAMLRIVKSVEVFKALKLQLQHGRLFVDMRHIARREVEFRKNLYMLQDRGAKLESDGTLMMSKSDAGDYAAALEAFAVQHKAFVKEVEEMLRG